MSSPRSHLVIQRVSRLPNIPSVRQLGAYVNAALDYTSVTAELTLRIVNASEARNLNSAFRGKDYATNVLTFVYHDAGAAVLMGDIVLCAPVLAREAKQQGKRLRDHYAHLTIHGVLHLAGMDHEQARAAKKMEAAEVAILGGFGIANPYRVAEHGID
jgi:probable rRNA maturation factor